MNKPKILYYDIETSPMQAWVWQCGKQYVNHKQLVDKRNTWGIICITYCWNDGKPAKAIDWGYEEQDTAKVVSQFDELIKQADMTIGKNNAKFDAKMINAARVLNGLPGLPEWIKYQDDLEQQMRKYLRLPSQSLDYISHQLGYGGKIKMEMQDWIDIVEKTKEGPAKFKKMIKYGKKDTEDTRSIYERLAEHFEPKFNMAVYTSNPVVCKNCGGFNLIKGGVRYGTASVYQDYKCTDCLGSDGKPRYAGRRTIGARGKEGRMI